MTSKTTRLIKPHTTKIAPVPDNITATLKVVGGPAQGATYRLQKGETKIGRGEEADFRIDDEAMSRAHACVRYQDREFRVADLGSANGTLLNGSKVKEYALRNGDKLLLGESLVLFGIARNTGL